MTSVNTDVLIIGAGASGLAAATRIRDHGYRVMVAERDSGPGGILNQCIHNGFGLHYYGEELTGPEFSHRLISSSLEGIEYAFDTTVIEMTEGADGLEARILSTSGGMRTVKCRAIVLAMGCRERNRGNIHIPGTRPAGIFTAGLAQRLVNIEGYIPGQEVIVIGSGDIGLIMARRMTWVGAKVHGVVEIQPYPSGITRNIVQCLNDFEIPLYLSHVISRIYGTHRVEAVEISPAEHGRAVADKSFTVECDTVLLSVGLIPENELSRKFGVEINQETGGPLVDSSLMSSRPGVFACGNVLHVHDLVDYACEEAERCADGVERFLSGATETRGGTVTASANVRYTVPGRYSGDRENRFYLRPMVVRNEARLIVRCGEEVLIRKKLPHVQPSEMVSFSLPAETARALHDADIEVLFE